MNLNSILIGSENPERLVDYYTKLFGKPTLERGRLRRLADRLGSRHRRAARQGQGQERQPRADHLEHREPGCEGRLRPLQGGWRNGDRGAVRPGEVSDADDAVIATFADPDDNYFQLMSPMPAEMLA